MAGSVETVAVMFGGDEAPRELWRTHTRYLRTLHAELYYGLVI